MKKVILIASLALVALFALAIGVWRFLAPDDRATPVPYAELTRDIESGGVDQVRIRDASYEYRVRGSSVIKRAEGPQPTFDQLATLHVPKIVFETSDPPKQQVPFSEFLAEVGAGRVDHVHVHGQRYTYDVAGRTRETVGPKATRAEIEQHLKPVAKIEVD